MQENSACVKEREGTDPHPGGWLHFAMPDQIHLTFRRVAHHSSVRMLGFKFAQTIALDTADI